MARMLFCGKRESLLSELGRKKGSLSQYRGR